MGAGAVEARGGAGQLGGGELHLNSIPDGAINSISGESVPRPQLKALRRSPIPLPPPHKASQADPAEMVLPIPQPGTPRLLKEGPHTRSRGEKGIQPHMCCCRVPRNPLSPLLSLKSSLRRSVCWGLGVEEPGSDPSFGIPNHPV